MAGDSCQFCNRIGLTLSRDEPFDVVELGSYSELQECSRTCHNCSVIVSSRTAAYEHELTLRQSYTCCQSHCQRAIFRSPTTGKTRFTWILLHWRERVQTQVLVLSSTLVGLTRQSSGHGLSAVIAIIQLRVTAFRI